MSKHHLLSLGVAVGLLLILGSAAVSFAQEEIDLTHPTFGDFDPATIKTIDPADFPVLPPLTDQARHIFERGQAREVPRNPQMFSKVGDSMTASANFLVAFGDDDYDLGDYTKLEAVIEFFRAAGEETETNAFNRENYANSLGFSTASALDSTWANSDLCEKNESPLACEYRLSNAAFALIMFGTNDVMAFDAATFDYFMREVVLATIEADVIPVLYTMPIRPESPELSQTFNQIILKIATDYDIPVINLIVALEPLPNYGVDLEDTLHLTTPKAPDTAATFTEASLGAGYTVRNLVTLQALHQLLTELDLLPDEG